MKGARGDADSAEGSGDGGDAGQCDEGVGREGLGEGIGAAGFDGEDLGFGLPGEGGEGLHDAAEEAAAADGADDGVGRVAVGELVGKFVDESCVAGPDVRVVEGREIDCFVAELLGFGHDGFAHVGVGVGPAVAVDEDVGGAGGFDLEHDGRFGGGGDDDGAFVAEGGRGGDCC